MKKILSYLEILFGSTLTAMAFGSIILQQGFVAGGVTGLAKILNSFIPVSLSMIVMLLNVLLFVLGYFFIGKQFVVKTLIVTFYFPMMLELFQNNNYFTSLISDPLLSSILAGMLIGVGSGLIIRGEGSGGGFDVIGVILNKYFNIPISLIVGICDCSILLIQAFNQSLLSIIYGLLVIIITSYSMKYVLTYGKGETQILIFSENYEELRKELYQKADVGLTFLKGEMGYTKKPINVIIVITSYKKLNRVKTIIKDVDPTAFVVVDNVTSVIGKGYTLSV